MRLACCRWAHSSEHYCHHHHNQSNCFFSTLLSVFVFSVSSIVFDEFQMRTVTCTTLVFITLISVLIWKRDVANEWNATQQSCGTTIRIDLVSRALLRLGNELFSDFRWWEKGATKNDIFSGKCNVIGVMNITIPASVNHVNLFLVFFSMKLMHVKEQLSWLYKIHYYLLLSRIH